MSLAPLLTATPAIFWHAMAALAALGLGLFQVLGPKGRTAHRVIGWIWVMLMISVAVSSLFIHEIRLVGPWSPIHILSILTPVSLFFAVRSARRHDVNAHSKAMWSTFFFALIFAGLFTLLPGRIMGGVVFGFPVHQQSVDAR